MGLLWYFIRITLYPVAAILICGFIAWVCRRLFIQLLGYGGYQAVQAASIIGTPIHELGHALMCLIFGHKIQELVLWQPDFDDDRLGYVRHTYNSDNLYHRLGNLFIGTGPIFSGMAVLSLMLAMFFPNTWHIYTDCVASLLAGSASGLDILFAGLRMIPSLLGELGSKSAPLWLQIPALLVMLSVSLHINLSPADIEGAFDAFLPYLMIMLAIALVTSLFGSTVTGLVLAALKVFNAFMMAMFTVVLVFAAAQVALALLIRVVLDRIGK